MTGFGLWRICLLVLVTSTGSPCVIAKDLDISRLPALARSNVLVPLKYIEPGGVLTVKWWNLPILVLRRSVGEIEQVDRVAARSSTGDQHHWFSALLHAGKIHPLLPNLLAVDQLSLEPARSRSRTAEFLVVVGFSPYDGCRLQVLPKQRSGQQEVPSNAAARLRSTCGAETFDTTGRVLPGHGYPQAWHLYIPPHQFLADGELLIGLGQPPRAVPDIDFELQVNYARLPPVERLLEAARRGRVDLVENSLDFGLKVDSRDQEGNSSLLVAALNGQQNVVVLLLERGSDVNLANVDGFTPLYAAVLGSAPSVVKALLANGADVNHICNHQVCRGNPLNAAITWIQTRDERATMVSLLRRAGADPYVEYNGKNAFDWALQNFYEDLLPLLE